MTVRVTWFGDRAVLVEVTDPADRAATLTHLRAAFPELEVRPGLQAVLVAARTPDPGLRERVRTSVQDVTGRASQEVSGSLIEIPVTYAGEDLDAAAAQLGCSAEQVTRAHAAQVWTVAMMGFAPGFGYLAPADPPRLPWGRIGRLARPRTRVPAGSVAVAAGMTAIYPAPMPGGWLLIGSSTVTVFDAGHETRPALLQPGDQVRFRPVAS